MSNRPTGQCTSRLAILTTVYLVAVKMLLVLSQDVTDAAG